MEKYRHNRIRQGGFTLVELLMATMVTTIILTALATLASAMSNADRETKNMSEQQAQIRYATLRLTELIRNANHIVPLTTSSYGFCIWTEKDMDWWPDGDELVFVELVRTSGSLSGTDIADEDFEAKLAGTGKINLLEFPDSEQPYYLDSISNGTARTDAMSSSTSRTTTILPECSNVTLVIDGDRKNVGLSFDISENGTARTYEIFAEKRCTADHVIDGDGDIIYEGIYEVKDDDL